MQKYPTKKSAKSSQQGFTLIETLIACVILLIISVGTASLFGIAIARNSDQGDRGTRATEYATDKMEQLMALQFSDTTSDVTVTPTCTVANGCTPTSGKGLSAGVGGSTGYYDYIDSTTGQISTTKPTFGYQRQWTIVDTTTSYLKTITVTVTPIGGASKLAPSTTLISQKGNY